MKIELKTTPEIYPLDHLTLLTFKTLRPSKIPLQDAETPETSFTTANKIIQTFLQGQLTCDLHEVTPTMSRLFSHCNLQGRMISLGRLVEYQGNYLMILPQSIAEGARLNLQKYAQFSKISVQEETGFSFTGLRILNPSEIPEHIDYPRKLNQTRSESENTLLICIQESPLRLLKIQKSSDTDSSAPSRSAEWLCQEIENQSPYLTPETVGKFLPHDINLPEKLGVSFKKGCFLGQEIVARMEHLGKLKKKMIVEILSASIPEVDSRENIICESQHDGKSYRLRLVSAT
jgi:folate-binding protein YgfZ